MYSAPNLVSHALLGAVPEANTPVQAPEPPSMTTNHRGSYRAPESPSHLAYLLPAGRSLIGFLPPAISNLEPSDRQCYQFDQFSFIVHASIFPARSAQTGTKHSMAELAGDRSIAAPGRIAKMERFFSDWSQMWIPPWVRAT